MRITKKLLIVVIAGVCGLAALWLCTSSHAGEINYEVQPQVAVPYGYTPTMHASRLMDILERLLVQSQQVTFNQLTSMDSTLKTIMQKLEAIEKSNAELSQRLSRVETALGISQPQPAQQGSPAKPEKKEKGGF